MSAKKSRRRKPTEAQLAARKARTEQLHAEMVEKIGTLTDTDQWRKFLTATASFHDYSFHNVMMILTQNPDATQVAGYRSWQDRGRQVRKGERGLQIHGYRTYKRSEIDSDTGEQVEKTAAYFPLVSVFDVSQTDPMEGFEDATEIARHLTGADDTDIFGRCAAFLQAQGWTVEHDELPGKVNGRTLLDGSHRVLIEETLSEAQAARTLLHEAAHVLLHADADGQADREALEHRGTGEVEAESVAYVIAGILGMDSAAYSIGYVAGWAGGDIDAIQQTAQRVLAAVHTLADALDPAEIEQQQTAI